MQRTGTEEIKLRKDERCEDKLRRQTHRSRAFGSFFERNGLGTSYGKKQGRGKADVANLFFIHGSDDSDQQILAFFKSGHNLSAELTLGDPDVIFWSAIIRHEVKEAFVNVNLEG